MSVNQIFHRFGEMEAEIGNEKFFGDFPGGAVVKMVSKTSSSVGSVGSILGQGS